MFILGALFCYGGNSLVVGLLSDRKYMEVLTKLNINGIMDTTYSYGNERLTIERFDGWTGYYTYEKYGLYLL